ncbi:alpha/beta hydrolase family esterase [Bacteroidota bacterium]
MKNIFTTLLIYLILATTQIFADEIIVDGMTRTYTLFIPENSNGKNFPLLIALHGGGGTGEGMKKLTDFNNYADEYGFAVVYPNGFEKHWNDRREVNRKYTNGKEIDDVKFLTNLIDTLVFKYNIDSNRVFVSGISNGGAMSFYLALNAPEKFAGAAPVAISMPTHMINDDTNVTPIPIMIIFGDEDPLVPYNGGEISIGKIKRGKVIPVNDAVDFWVKNNNCNEEPEVTYINKRMDKTKAVKYVYIPKQDGAEVVYWLIEGGGHTWPGGWQYLPKFVVGATSREIDACEEILKFFESVSK